MTLNAGHLLFIFDRLARSGINSGLCMTAALMMTTTTQRGS